jgi:sarcosine oxidase
MASYDLIVVGLGVMGLSTVYQAKRANPSWRIVGVERFDLLHDKGSSHGESRLTRQAYSEGLAYVPLMLDAHVEWDNLGKAAEQQLLNRSGVVYVSSDPKSEVVRGALLAAEKFSLPGVQVLEDAHRELGALRPGMKGEKGEIVLWEPQAGWLAADKIRESLHRLSREMGVEMRFSTRVSKWRRSPVDGIVSVELESGEEVRGRALVVTAGCWTQQLVQGLELHPRRAVLSWFEVLPEYEEERAKGPGFMLERKGHVFIYGFPAIRGAGGKLLLKLRKE